MFLQLIDKNVLLSNNLGFEKCVHINYFFASGIYSFGYKSFIIIYYMDSQNMFLCIILKR